MQNVEVSGKVLNDSIFLSRNLPESMYVQNVFGNTIFFRKFFRQWKMRSKVSLLLNHLKNWIILSKINIMLSHSGFHRRRPFIRWSIRQIVIGQYTGSSPFHPRFDPVSSWPLHKRQRVQRLGPFGSELVLFVPIIICVRILKSEEETTYRNTNIFLFCAKFSVFSPIESSNFGNSPLFHLDKTSSQVLYQNFM